MIISFFLRKIAQVRLGGKARKRPQTGFYVKNGHKHVALRRGLPYPFTMPHNSSERNKGGRRPAIGKLRERQRAIIIKLAMEKWPGVGRSALRDLAINAGYSWEHYRRVLTGKRGYDEDWLNYTAVALGENRSKLASLLNVRPRLLKYREAIFRAKKDLDYARYDDAQKTLEALQLRSEVINDATRKAEVYCLISRYHRKTGNLHEAKANLATASKSLIEAKSGDPLIRKKLASKVDFERLECEYIQNPQGPQFRIASESVENLLRSQEVPFNSNVERFESIRHRAQCKKVLARMKLFLGKYESARKIFADARSDFENLGCCAYDCIMCRIGEAEATHMCGPDSSVSETLELCTWSATEMEYGQPIRRALVFNALCSYIHAPAHFEKCRSQYAELLDGYEPEDPKRIILHLLNGLEALRDLRLGQALAIFSKAEKCSESGTTNAFYTGTVAALCQAETLRKMTRFESARSLFELTYQRFYAMNCLWGSLRSGLGLQSVGVRISLPSRDELSGVDRRLVESRGNNSLLDHLLLWPA